MQRFIGEKDIFTNKEGQSAKTDSVFNAVHNCIVPLCCNTYLDVEPRPMIFRLETQRGNLQWCDPEDNSGRLFVRDKISIQFINKDEAIHKAKMIYAWMEV